MNALRVVLCSLLLLIATLPLTAQGMYTQIDDPNAVGSTSAQSINTAGDIAGTYLDSNGLSHGFLLSGGNFVDIDYPDGRGTSLAGINDLGQIVGNNGSFPPVAFVYDIATQAFTTIGYPRATYTIPTGIDNSGRIVGYYTFNSGGDVSGFELIGSTYRTIKPPRASQGYVYGISASGVIAGYVLSISQTNDNFLFQHGKYNPITIPNAPGAVIRGINPAGNALVGYYQPSFGTSVGFVYQANTTQTLQFPGALDTTASGIDSGGEVVGFFFDSAFHVHGFTWTPSADAAKP